MKLIIDKIAFTRPPEGETYALALVLTPLGAEVSLPGVWVLQRRLLSDIENGWQVADHVDPEEFLVVFLQVWESNDPFRSNAILAGLRPRLERTPLGQRLIRGEGLPSEGIARGGGAEVMRRVAEALVGAGDVAAMTYHDPLYQDWREGEKRDVKDPGCRVTVSLHLEAPGAEVAWRPIADTDVVDDRFRIRNPFGEEQTITDRHEGDRASFDDGDTWTVPAMAAAGWQTALREGGANDGGTPEDEAEEDA